MRLSTDIEVTMVDRHPPGHNSCTLPEIDLAHPLTCKCDRLGDSSKRIQNIILDNSISLFTHLKLMNAISSASTCIENMRPNYDGVCASVAPVRSHTQIRSISSVEYLPASPPDETINLILARGLTLSLYLCLARIR